MPMETLLQDCHNNGLLGKDHLNSQFDQNLNQLGWRHYSLTYNSIQDRMFASLQQHSKILTGMVRIVMVFTGQSKFSLYFHWGKLLQKYFSQGNKIQQGKEQGKRLLLGSSNQLDNLDILQIPVYFKRFLLSIEFVLQLNRNFQPSKYFQLLLLQVLLQWPLTYNEIYLHSLVTLLHHIDQFQGNIQFKGRQYKLIVQYQVDIFLFSMELELKYLQGIYDLWGIFH